MTVGAAPLRQRTGAAPIDVSSGENNHHRLNRVGNRRLNHGPDVAAVVQLRMPGPGQDYYRRRAAGKTHNEARRCLKRGISDASIATSPTTWQQATREDTWGAPLQSSATDLIPMASTS